VFPLPPLAQHREVTMANTTWAGTAACDECDTRFPKHQAVLTTPAIEAYYGEGMENFALHFCSGTCHRLWHVRHLGHVAKGKIP
jgi:hypothetical protein